MVQPTTDARVNLLLPDEPRWSATQGSPIIALEGVHKRFDDLEILKGVDLEIPAGRTTVICGESGSGKSVLLRMMNGLILPDEGRVLLFGEDTQAVSQSRLLALRKRVSMVFQNYALMDSLTVTQNIAFPIYENTSIRWNEVVPMVEELLALLDLSDAGNKLPSQLSGGMKKRVSLARAVISNPEIVLFDEPTTGLDPVMIDFVDELIERTQAQVQMTSVIISHDMHSTLRLADRIAMLEDGVVTVTGTIDEVLQSKTPLVDVFFEGADEELSDVPHTASDEGASEDIVVSVRDLTKSFGDQQVLKGINLDIPKDKITVLIGASGSGKSVFMKHLIGLMFPDSGSVKTLGQDVGSLSSTELIGLRRKVGMLFQSAALLDGMSVFDNVAFPLRERRFTKAEVRTETERMLEELRITDIATRMPADISNGQKKRVGLARAIVTKPEIMIYDEPTTGQDPVMIRYVDDMVVEAQELFDITSIVVSHDMLSTFRIAHRVALLHEGEIRAWGSPGVVRASTDPVVRRFIFAGTEAGAAAAAELEGR